MYGWVILRILAYKLQRVTEVSNTSRVDVKGHNLPVMKVYVSFDADHLGRMLGRMARADKPEEVRKLHQSIDRGNEIWKSWAESHGGLIISLGGDEGRMEIEADHLDELPKIREEYKTAVGSTVSVGVGVKLSEADKALLAAKLQGGDRIQLYTEDCDEILAEVEDDGKTESQKVVDEYLDPSTGIKKADSKFQGAHAGMQGPSQDHPETPATPSMGGEHSEVEALQNAIQAAPPVPGPDGQQIDYENLFHQAAQAQEQQDQNQPQSGDPQAKEKLREGVVKVLQAIKGHGQELEQIKASNPDLYQSLTGLVQSMIGMAREIFSPGQAPQQEVQKSELEKGDVINLNPPQGSGKKFRAKTKVLSLPTPEEPQARQRAAAGSVPNVEEPKLAAKGIGKGNNVYDYSHYLAPGQGQEMGFGIHVTHSPGEYDNLMRVHLMHQGQPQASMWAYPNTDVNQQKIDYKDPMGILTDHGHITWDQVRGAALFDTMKNALRNHQAWVKYGSQVQKAALEPGKTGRHETILPVGSQIDAGPDAAHKAGRIKVEDPATGKTKWRQVRANMVMDPKDGTPTSSRNV